MKEKFLKLAVTCVLAAMTAAPVALAADDCCGYDSCYTGCNYCDEQCISVFADYLYWNVCPSHLNFGTEDTSIAVTATPPAGGSSTLPFTPSSFNLFNPVNALGGRKDHHVNTKYKSGFRVGFAYHMPDQWDLEVAYTYFHPNYKGHRRACGDSHFTPCGIPSLALSLPIDLALEVPVQPFSLAIGSTTDPNPLLTSPFDAVNFVVSGTTGEGGAFSSLSSAPVTGFLTASGISSTAHPTGDTFAFLPADLDPPVPSGDLKPLIVTGTDPLINNFLIPVPTVAFDVARVRATLKYDLVDILFAKRYDCGGCFDYVPYAGARFLNIEEDIHTHYGVLNSSSSSNLFCGCDDVSNSFLLRTRSKFKLPAGGITFGTRLNYAVCDCFKLFGHVGASILGGNAKQSFRWDNFLLNNALAQVVLPPNITVTGSGSSATVTGTFPWTITSNLCPTHRHTSHCQVIFGLDASLGLGYEWCMCNIPVLIGAGYEIQSWWNMPQHRGSDCSGGGGSSSFTVHGLFVRLGFGF